MQITEERFHELYEQLMNKELDGAGTNEIMSGFWSGYRLDLIYRLMAEDDEYYRSKASYFLFELGSLKASFFHTHYAMWLDDISPSVRWHIHEPAMFVAQRAGDRQLLAKCFHMVDDEIEGIRRSCAYRFHRFKELWWQDMIHSQEFCEYSAWSPLVKKAYGDNSPRESLIKLLYGGEIGAYMAGLTVVWRRQWLEDLMDLMPKEDWERLRSFIHPTPELMGPERWYDKVEWEAKTLDWDKMYWAREIKKLARK